MLVLLQNLNHTLKQIFVTIIVGFAIGLLMAVVSNLFVMGIAFLTQMREAAGGPHLTVSGRDYVITPIITLLLAASLIIFIRKRFGLTRFYGPADSIYAAHRTDNELDVKAGMGSTLAAFVAAGGGASVGQYGPLVHFGATLGSYFRRMTHVGLSSDVFIGCGVAGAIAAGFNAPLAGLVFALEAVIRHFSLRAVAPITISSITAAAASQAFLGDRYLFRVEAPDIDLMTMLPPTFLAGVVFGFIAVAYMFAIRNTTRLTALSGLTMVQSTLIGALVCGSIGVFYPEVLGLGSQTVNAMLAGSVPVEQLLILAFVKILVTAICLGTGLFGGVFSPAIFIGAAIGGALTLIFAGYGGGALALVLTVTGMGAVVAPVIGAPIAAILVILEFTQSYDMALLGMIGVVTACLVSYIFYGASFFDRQLRDRGLDLHKGRGYLELMETPLIQFAHQDYSAFSPRSKVKTVAAAMAKAGRVEAYVVDGDQTYLGKLNYLQLVAAPDGTPVGTLADEQALSIKADASLLQAIEAAGTFVGESIPVIDRETNKLKGIVTEGDLFSAYLDLQDRVTDIEGK